MSLFMLNHLSQQKVQNLQRTWARVAMFIFFLRNVKYLLVHFHIFVFSTNFKYVIGPIFHSRVLIYELITDRHMEIDESEDGYHLGSLPIYFFDFYLFT
jgi:hypothetical protein